MTATERARIAHARANRAATLARLDAHADRAHGGVIIGDCPRCIRLARVGLGIDLARIPRRA